VQAATAAYAITTVHPVRTERMRALYDPPAPQ